MIQIYTFVKKMPTADSHFDDGMSRSHTPYFASSLLLNKHLQMFQPISVKQIFTYFIA